MATHDRRSIPHVLAVASGGGHWVQLLRMMPAFDGCRVSYVTTNASYRSQVMRDQGKKNAEVLGQENSQGRFHVVHDANRWNKLRLIWLALRMLVIVMTERPSIVISTGAAPGYFALRLGRLLGARTIWVDSVANVEELSMSGQKIGKHADLWLTQWPHLAKPSGPHYAGAVL